MNRPNRKKYRSAKAQKALFTALACVAVLAVVAGVAIMLLQMPAAGKAEKPGGEPTATQAPAPAPVGAPETEEATPAPTPEAEGDDPLALAAAAAARNATKDAPQLADPATWNEAGKALMESLRQQPDFAGMDLTATEGQPYLAAVNRAASVVTIYTPDENNEYTVPYMAMVCSGGTDTPIGYFATPVNYQWRLLAGPCYGQYATRIWSSYLFHSVPYYTQHKDDLEYDQYNQLGTLASLGCIRLAVVDVKWIYDNCPLEMPVIIYDDAENPGPMGKPGTIAVDPTDEAKRGWDPTDPDTANPWDPVYRSGTAIRSDAAQAEWDAAQADGRWDGSINPADLQGYSTDSSKVGTRG
ncbi:MAG: L,D-transpeptidase [Gemmiger sp.]|nr:L,D-transpeptidase [Gemmiger sp.]